MFLFGRVWLERAEAFTVFFRIVSLLAPARWSAEKRQHVYDVTLKLGLPGSRLIDEPPLTYCETAFILLALATVSFDGLSRTFAWNAWFGINPLEFPGRSALLLQNTFGLALSFAILASAFVAAFLLGDFLSGRRSHPARLKVRVLSLLPIAMGFHFAHYLPNLLLDWKHALRAVSDPFAQAWDILGTAGLNPGSPMAFDHAAITLIYNLQTFVIVLAHVVAVSAGHRLALGEASPDRAFLSQAPMTLLMIAYTIFGLWLLSSPVVG
jgi:hypothetical protein